MSRTEETIRRLSPENKLIVQLAMEELKPLIERVKRVKGLSDNQELLAELEDQIFDIISMKRRWNQDVLTTWLTEELEVKEPKKKKPATKKI